MNWTLTISVVTESGSIAHHQMSQRGEKGIVHVGGRPSGETSLAGAVEYLRSRQPGWSDCLTEGITGITVRLH